MDINGSVCLVTGANRGLGRAYVRALLERGARKVYAAARHPESSDMPGVVPVRLDITRPDEVARAASECPDVTLLVNNAGLAHGNQPLDAGADAEAREEMETNYFGTMAMCRTFIPVLEANGAGALVNVLSVASWVAPPVNGTYSASKAAEWLMTNAVRRALRPRGILVVGVHASFIDTDMSASIPASAKISADSVALQTLEAIEAGREEVLADERTRHVKSALPNDLALLYPADRTDPVRPGQRNHGHGLGRPARAGADRRGSSRRRGGAADRGPADGLPSTTGPSGPRSAPRSGPQRGVVGTAGAPGRRRPGARAGPARAQARPSCRAITVPDG